MLTTAIPVPVFVLQTALSETVSCTVGKFMHTYLDVLGISKDTVYNGRYQLFYRHANVVWQFLLKYPAVSGSPEEQEALWKKFKEHYRKTPDAKNADAFEAVPLNQLFKRMVAFTAANDGSGVLKTTFAMAGSTGFPNVKDTFTELFSKGVLLSLPPKKAK